MPSRGELTKTVFGGPQGSDAFVKVKRLTVNEMTVFLARVRGDGFTPEQADEAEADAREHLAEVVLDWNLVGDNDEPLAKPHENPEAFGLLLQDELTWVIKAVRGTTDEEKKGTKPKTK